LDDGKSRLGKGVAVCNTPSHCDPSRKESVTDCPTHNNNVVKKRSRNATSSGDGEGVVGDLDLPEDDNCDCDCAAVDFFRPGGGGGEALLLLLAPSEVDRGVASSAGPPAGGGGLVEMVLPDDGCGCGEDDDEDDDDNEAVAVVVLAFLVEEVVPAPAPPFVPLVEALLACNGLDQAFTAVGPAFMLCWLPIY